MILCFSSRSLLDSVPPNQSRLTHSATNRTSPYLGSGTYRTVASNPEPTHSATNRTSPYLGSGTYRTAASKPEPTHSATNRAPPYLAFNFSVNEIACPFVHCLVILLRRMSYEIWNKCYIYLFTYLLMKWGAFSPKPFEHSEEEFKFCSGHLSIMFFYVDGCLILAWIRRPRKIVSEFYIWITRKINRGEQEKPRMLFLLQCISLLMNRIP
jgi:hypothetical protein